jgi:hypothetical protein
LPNINQFKYNLFLKVNYIDFFNTNAFSANNVVEENIYMSLNMYNRKEREYFVSFRLLDDKAQIVSSVTQSFNAHKYFKCKDKNINAIIVTNVRQLLINTDVISKSIMLTTLS